jgi:hypothetical protein
MPRIHQWGYLKDDQGIPLIGADLNLYLTGTQDEATLYTTTASAASAADVLNQSTWATGASGFFEFWIGDQFEKAPSIGYNPLQYFDLVWSASGVDASGIVDRLHFFPPIFSVDETSQNTVKNKMLSNEQAFKFDQHSITTYSNAPHNLYPVDETDASDGTYNKVVTDELMNRIDTLLSSLLACGGEGISVTTSGALVETHTLYASAATAWPSPGAGWLSDWEKRKKITIASATIDSNLTNFPIAINISPSAGRSDQDLSDIFDDLGANSQKIAITEDDGQTEIYGEVERWDNGAEAALIHTKVPSVLAASDTDLYIYWDNSKADNTAYIGVQGDATAQNVWDSNYYAVYHFTDDPSGVTITDSTSNNRDGTPENMAADDLVAGPHEGYAFDLDNSGDLLDFGDIFDIPSGAPVTIETTYDIDNTTFNYIPGKWNAGNSDGWYLRLDTNGYLIFRISDDATGDIAIQTAAVNDYNDGNWHFVAATYNGNLAASGMFIRVDGADDSDSNPYNTDLTKNPTNADKVGYFGSNGDTKGGFGKGAELRFSNIVRADAWIDATYETLNDNTNSYSATEEILASPSAYYNDLVHTLARDTKYPIIGVYERDTRTMFDPFRIKDLTTDTIRIFNSPSGIDMEVTVIGEVVSGGVIP